MSVGGIVPSVGQDRYQATEHLLLEKAGCTLTAAGNYSVCQLRHCAAYQDRKGVIFWSLMLP